MMGPGKRANEINDNKELLDEFECACRGGDYEFSQQYKMELIKRLNVDVREEVRWFAEQMEAKLRENDHKRHWSELSDDYLIDRLYQEAQELWMAIKYEPRENVIKEAADVANFAMMIADNFSDRQKVRSR